MRVGGKGCDANRQRSGTVLCFECFINLNILAAACPSNTRPHNLVKLAKRHTGPLL